MIELYISLILQKDPLQIHHFPPSGLYGIPNPLRKPLLST